MTTLVTVRHVESGVEREHYSVDAADLLATGEYEQTAGPPIRVAPHIKPKPEPGPAYAKPPEPKPDAAPPALDRPHLKHRGFGKWDVFDAGNSRVNDAPLTKAAAEAALATLK